MAYTLNLLAYGTKFRIFSVEKQAIVDKLPSNCDILTSLVRDAIALNSNRI